MFATCFPPKAAPTRSPGLELTLLESESFPLSGRSWRGRAGVPEDGLRSVSPGRPPGLRPLARAHSGWPQAADSESDSARRNFKLAGELDLVFQAPAGRVMGQFSYSKAVPQTGPARVRVQGVGREDRDIVLYLGAGGTAFSLNAALRRLRAWHSDVPGAVSDADDWVGQPEGGVRVKPTERRLGRLEPARGGTARGSVFLGTDG
jgi:hypothetical protein